MAENYVLLETVDLTQSASSVIFDNIPQTGYTDLIVILSGRTNRSANGDDINISFNGSTSNFSSKFLYGNGSSASTFSATAIAGIINASSDTNDTFGNMQVYIPNYAGSNYKSYSIETVNENNATTAFPGLTAGLWSNTAAITQISFASNNAANFIQYTTASIYGIANVNTTPAIAPKAEGGNIVANDGTYWYHAFLTSGTFTPLTGLTCDILQVAGGGGGGSDVNDSAGGGGAGGLLYLTAQSLTSSNYSVAIGAGGAGGLATGTSTSLGFNGTNSTFGALTAAIGGGGGASTRSGSNAGSGGSGGGERDSSGAGSGTSGQGYAGGNGGGSNPYNAGGGGGATAAGTTASTSVKGTGGAGSNSYSNWASATSLGVSGYFAGGGGGGNQDNTGAGIAVASGGAGGGGNGGFSSNTQGNQAPVAGIINTGGGGGGGSNYTTQSTHTGGTGGSGVVIIRYAI